MKTHRHLLFFSLLFCVSLAETIVSVGRSGEWDDPLTWSTGSVPSDHDDVLIASGTEVFAESEVVVHSLMIEGNITVNAPLTATISITSEKDSLLSLLYAELRAASGELQGVTTCQNCGFEFDGIINVQQEYFSLWNNPSFDGDITLTGTQALVSFQCSILGKALRLNFSDSLTTKHPFSVKGIGFLVNNLVFDYEGGSISVSVINNGALNIHPRHQFISKHSFQQTGTLTLMSDSSFFTQGTLTSSGFIYGEGVVIGDFANIKLSFCGVPSFVTNSRVQGGSFHSITAKDTFFSEDCSFSTSSFEDCSISEGIVVLSGRHIFNGTLTMDSSQLLFTESATVSLTNLTINSLNSVIKNEGTLQLHNCNSHVPLENHGELISSFSDLDDLSSFGTFKVLDKTTLNQNAHLAGIISGNSSLYCDCQATIESASIGVPFYMTKSSQGTWKGSSSFTELNASNIAFMNASVNGDNATFCGVFSLYNSSFSSEKLSVSDGSLTFDNSSVTTQDPIVVTSLFSFKRLHVQNNSIVLQNSNASFSESVLNNCSLRGTGTAIFSGGNRLNSSSIAVMSQFYNKQFINGAIKFTEPFFCISCSLIGNGSELVVFSETSALIMDGYLEGISTQISDSQVSFNETTLSSVSVTGSFLSSVSLNGSFYCKDNNCLMVSESPTKCFSCNSRMPFTNFGAIYVTGKSSFSNLDNKGKFIVEDGECTIEQCSFSENGTVKGTSSSSLVIKGENSLCGRFSLPVTISGTINCKSDLSFEQQSTLLSSAINANSVTFNAVNVTGDSSITVSDAYLKGNSIINHCTVSFQNSQVSNTGVINMNSSHVICSASKMTNFGSVFMDSSTLTCHLENEKILESTKSTLSTLENSGTVDVHGTLDVVNLLSSSESMFRGDGLLRLGREGFSTIKGTVSCSLESFGTLSFEEEPVLKEAIIRGTVQGKTLAIFDKLTTFQAVMNEGVTLKVKSSYTCSGSLQSSKQAQIILAEGCTSECTSDCIIKGVLLNNEGKLRLDSSNPFTIHSSGSVFINSPLSFVDSIINGSLESSVPFFVNNSQINECTMKGKGTATLNNVIFNNTFVYCPVVISAVFGTARFTGKVTWGQFPIIEDAVLNISSGTMISSELFANNSVINFLGSVLFDSSVLLFCVNSTWNFHEDARVHNTIAKKLGSGCVFNSFKKFVLSQSNGDYVQIQNHGDLSVSGSNVSGVIVNMQHTVFNEFSKVSYTQEQNGVTVLNGTNVTGDFNMKGGELTGSGGFVSLDEVDLHDCVVVCELGKTISFPSTKDGVFVLKLDGMNPLTEYNVFDLGKHASNYSLRIQFSFIPPVSATFVPIVFQKESIPQHGTKWSFTGPFSPQAIQLIHNPKNLTITIVPCNGDKIINCVCPEQGFFFTEDGQCEECPPGSFSTNTSTGCQPCPNGTTTNDHITCLPIDTASLVDLSSSSKSPKVVTWVIPVIFFGILLLFILFTRKRKEKKEIVVTLEQEPDELDQHDEPLLLIPPVFPDFPVCPSLLFSHCLSSFFSRLHCFDDDRMKVKQSQQPQQQQKRKRRLFAFYSSIHLFFTIDFTQTG